MTKRRYKLAQICYDLPSWRDNFPGDRHDMEQSWRKLPAGRRKLGSSCRNTKRSRTVLSRRRDDLPGLCDDSSPRCDRFR
jgi:hypothetical protein